MQPQGHRVALKIAGSECSFETGRIARLASAAVIGRRGDDVVLATVVAAEEPRPGTDFLPLTVEYREKMAAAGRIPGSFGRREGRISDHEVLVSRLIDRTIRSLFPEDFHCEVQVQVSVLSADPGSDLPSLALLTACAAVHLSPVPFRGPAAGLRVATIRGQLLPFPHLHERNASELDFMVGAGPDGLVMVEGEAKAIAEDRCLAALKAAAEYAGRFQKAFAELRELAGIAKRPLPAAAPGPEVPAPSRAALDAALALTSKNERRAAIAAARQLGLAATPVEQQVAFGKAFDALLGQLVRERVLTEGKRLDGRGTTDIRPIWCEVGWLPRAHGSAVFTRGETQALVTCTLGSGDDAQTLDELGGLRQERFLLHYNFPPYSVNEIRPLRGPGRREIGHGFLARRGLAHALPDFADFPYVIRIESEISESNGSSSMATVCGGTLAMLQAGVPLAEPVAGIAMGLVTDGARTAVLSDILGDEDHLGDMDFKVVGTAQGITALQLDNKVGGLTDAQLATALAQARAGRLHILGEMSKTLAAPAADLSRYSPRVSRTEILPEAIGVLVGPRGANIKAIQAATGARVQVDDDGQVLVYAADAGKAQRAMRLVHDAAGVVSKGRLYRGQVQLVREFGAFVRINAMNEGLVPQEELGEPVASGDEIVVMVLGADDRGRLRLSRKQALGADEAAIVN